MDASESDSPSESDIDSLSSAFSDDAQIITPPRKKRKLSPSKKKGLSTPQQIQSTLESMGVNAGVTQWDDDSDDLSSELSEEFDEAASAKPLFYSDIMSISTTTSSKAGNRKVENIQHSKSNDDMTLKEMILDEHIRGKEMPSVTKRREELRKRRAESNMSDAEDAQNKFCLYIHP